MDLTNCKQIVKVETRQKTPTITISCNQVKLNAEAIRTLESRYFQMFADTKDKVLYLNKSTFDEPNSFKVAPAINSSNIGRQIKEWLGLDMNKTYIGTLKDIGEGYFKVKLEIKVVWYENWLNQKNWKQHLLVV